MATINKINKNGSVILYFPDNGAAKRYEVFLNSLSVTDQKIVTGEQEKFLGLILSQTELNLPEKMYSL